MHVVFVSLLSTVVLSLTPYPTLPDPKTLTRDAYDMPPAASPNSSQVFTPGPMSCPCAHEAGTLSTLPLPLPEDI